MITLVDILKNITKIVSEETGIELSFHHGNTLTVVNYITKLRQELRVFPAIILFTEGVYEIESIFYSEFYIPKIAICESTVDNATENQRLESNFKNIIYKIFKSFSNNLKEISLEPNLNIKRSDIPYFTTNKNENKFNQLVDGSIITDLRIQVDHEEWECFLKKNNVK